MDATLWVSGRSLMGSVVPTSQDNLGLGAVPPIHPADVDNLLLSWTGSREK